MERVTPGQRPRPNYGHPQATAPGTNSSNESPNGRSIIGGFPQVRLFVNLHVKGIFWYSLVPAETALSELGRRLGGSATESRRCRAWSRVTAFAKRCRIVVDLAWIPAARVTRTHPKVGGGGYFACRRVED